MDPKRFVGVSLLIVCYLIFTITLIRSVLLGFSGIYGVIAIICVVGMLALAAVALQVSGDKVHIGSRKADTTLAIASQTVTFMREGMSQASAQSVCEVLLPAVHAVAVCITDRETIMGYAGVDRENHEQGTTIQTEVTMRTLEDGKPRLVETSSAIGFKGNGAKLKGAIIVPLIVQKDIVGTLKFYYTHPRRMDDEELAMAKGFGQLLETQLALSYLEQQTELATRMELRALQRQINPHFLFNTINTIASYTRIDPEKARKMLREFAIYYRRLLENSEDLISLAQEFEQTERYLMFQRARFGEESVTMTADIEPGVDELKVPAFIIQPLVENAVGHGRRDDGSPLNIVVKAYHIGDNVVIEVSDDGVGIPADKLNTVVEGGSKTGMGIAMKNVNARLKGYYGQASGMHVYSELGHGTTVFMTLYDVLLTQELYLDDEDDDFDEDDD